VAHQRAVNDAFLESGMRVLLLAMLVISSVIPTFAASFTLIEETRFGQWRAVRYENNSTQERFCALESVADNPLLRVNQYLGDNDTFLEIYDSTWVKMEGAVRFSLEFFSPGMDMPTMELRGKSWGDSYTYDILDKDTYLVLIGLLMTAHEVRILNSNGAAIATIGLDGSARAARSFGACLSR
jgi:hypothetical protein